jgi:MFS family permease
MARKHQRTILTWGIGVGILTGFSAIVVDRWGQFWFALSLGVMAGVLMFTYVALPARLLGLRTQQSRRDKLSAAAVGGAIGAVICSPPYALGRVALIMIGSHKFRYVAILLLIIAIILQTGATSAVKAVKMSAKIVAGSTPDEADAEVFGTT